MPEVPNCDGMARATAYDRPQSPESILKSRIDLRHQIGAVRIRFGKRRSRLRVRVGIRGRQLRVRILHHTVPICWIWDVPSLDHESWLEIAGVERLRDSMALRG